MTRNRVEARVVRDLTFITGRKYKILRLWKFPLAPPVKAAWRHGRALGCKEVKVDEQRTVGAYSKENQLGIGAEARSLKIMEFYLEGRIMTIFFSFNKSAKTSMD